MQIHLFHTNDIHSNFDFLKRVQAYLKRHKRPVDLYLDSGDFLDMKNTLVMSDRGKSALNLFAAAGLDGICVGNNELDLGRETLEVLTSLSVPLFSGNIAGSDGHRLPALPSSVLLERAGRRFLLIGVSPYFGKGDQPGTYNKFFLMGGVQTTDPFAAIRSALAENAGQFEHVILLSHSGSVWDERFMAEFPEIDLCLGGHFHELLAEGCYSQSGMGEALGRMTLELDENGLHVLENLQITLPEAEDPDFAQKLRESEATADRLLSHELPIVQELDFDPYRECPLGNFICDALLRHFGGDLAVMHQGIAEGPLKRPVSKKSLLQTFPSKLNPTFYKIRGKALKEAARLSLDPDFIRRDGHGAGFRGSTLGALAFSHNVKIVAEPFSMEINGRDVKDDALYRLVTDDYLQRGSGYPPLAVPDEEADYHVWFIRDLVEASMNQAEVFSALEESPRIDYR